jgi:hypothetical protein
MQATHFKGGNREELFRVFSIEWTPATDRLIDRSIDHSLCQSLYGRIKDNEIVDHMAWKKLNSEARGHRHKQQLQATEDTDAIDECFSFQVLESSSERLLRQKRADEAVSDHQ